MKNIFYFLITAVLFLAVSCDEKKEVEKEVIIEKDTTLRSEHMSMATVWEVSMPISLT